MSSFNSEHNRAVWFDIPVADVERAARFYAAVLNISVQQATNDDQPFAVLEHHEGNGGCLVLGKEEIASGGVLLYMNVNGRIHDAVGKVVPNGGSILHDVHSIGPHGFRAVVLDSEGNRIALHSETDG